ncbi:MAG: hypothetical protein AAB467_03365 [Patescibacteria group bacterium]
MPEKFTPSEERGRRTEKNKTRNTLLGLFLSLGLHIGAVGAAIPEVRRGIADEAGELAESAERTGREFLERQFASETEADYKNLLEKGGATAPITFYLKSESFHGISEDETLENAQVFEQLKQKFLEETKVEPNQMKVLYELSQEEGRYDPTAALLADVLRKNKDERKGNCEARAKFMDSLVSEIYPNSERKLQWFNGDKQNDKAPHVRLIMKIGNNWYALEGLPEKLTDADLAGTTLTDTDIFKKSYLQKEANPEEKPLSGKPVSSNSFFHVAFEHPPTQTFSGSDLKEDKKDYEKRLAKTYEQAASNFFKIQYLTATEIKARAEKQKPNTKEHKDQTPQKFTKEELEEIARSGSLFVWDGEVRDLTELKGIKLKSIDVDNSDITHFSALDLSEVRYLSLSNVRGEIDLKKIQDHDLDYVSLYGIMTIKNFDNLMTEGFETDRVEYLAKFKNIPLAQLTLDCSVSDALSNIYISRNKINSSSLSVNNLYKPEDLKRIINLAARSEKVTELYINLAEGFYPNFSDYNPLKKRVKDGSLSVTITSEGVLTELKFPD